MKKPRRRTRSVRTRVGAADVQTGWADSTLTVRGWTVEGWRRAVIEIRTPYELHVLRRALDEIETYWKRQLV